MNIFYLFLVFSTLPILEIPFLMSLSIPLMLCIVCEPESPHVDKFLEKLFLQEIEQQCEFADRAYNGIKEGLSLQSIGQVFSSLQSFLIAIANIFKKH
jgi:hypothetical protein